ncbi:hypothetical protein ACIGXM_19680 [Kitasatospora sp. NPDC052896]
MATEVRAERAMLAALHGGCSVPIGDERLPAVVNRTNVA